MDSKLPPGIRPGTEEWAAAARDIRRTTLAARIRTNAKIPPDAQPIALVADALGISVATIRTRISKRKLQAFHVGALLYVRPIDVVAKPPISEAKRAADLRNLSLSYSHRKARQPSPQTKVETERASGEPRQDASGRAQGAAGRAEEASDDVQVLPGKAMA